VGGGRGATGDTASDLGEHAGNFALVKRNVELSGYANVELVNAAVSDRIGWCRLYRSAGNAGDHRLHHTPGDARPSVEVEVVTPDGALHDRRGGVDFVKIDVQGSEGAAHEGKTAGLARSPRVKMAVEFWPAGLERSGYGAARLLARLQALGFRPHEVDEAAFCVRLADPRKLLEAYPASDEKFTNLLCVKAPLPPRHDPGG
jgi:FkbM family methyltransferase